MSKTPAKTGRTIGVAFVIHLVLVWFSIMSPIKYTAGYLQLTHTVFDHFIQWDSQWYSAIGHFGYKIPLYAQLAFIPEGNRVPFVPELRATVFFPLVPMVVHVFGMIGTVILTNFIFLVTLWLMYHVFCKTMSERTAFWGVLGYSINPAFIYESALYTETYMVFFTLLIVYGINKNTKMGQVLACIAGFCASLTHEMGLFTAIFGLRYIRTKKYISAMVFVSSVAAGWCSFLLYLWVRFGNPFVIFEAESTWTRTWRFPFASFAKELQYFPNRHSMILDLAGVALLGIAAIFHIYTSLKRDHDFIPSTPLSVGSLETALWVLAYFALCMCTFVPWNPLMSLTRLLSVIWPIYGFIWLREKTYLSNAVRVCSLASFCIIGFIGSTMFTHGFFFE